MPKETACYFGQLKPMIGTRATIDQFTLPKVIRGEVLSENDPCLRFTKTGLLEVYRPIDLVVIRPWLKPPEIPWNVLPGQVLRPLRRKATPSEISLIEAGSATTKDWKAKRMDGDWTVAIVEKFEEPDGIFSLIRQLDRHIWSSLVGREQEGIVVSFGDKQQMEQTIRVLALITLWLTQETEISQAKIEEVRQGLMAIVQDMEGLKAKAKVSAREILSKIAQETGQENLLSLVLEAQKAISDRRRENIQMAIACSKRARRILEDTVLGKIDRGVREAFTRLAHLQKQLASPIKTGLTLRQLERIARQIFNTYAFWVRVATFNPYWARIHSKEVTTLRYAQSRAGAYGARGLRNDLKRALAKVEILTKGVGIS